MLAGIFLSVFPVSTLVKGMLSRQLKMYYRTEKYYTHGSERVKEKFMVHGV